MIYRYIILILLIVLVSNCALAKEHDTDTDNYNCLVEAIYFEARSEDKIGQLAVANVIMNRVHDRRFPNTICDVVHDGIYWNNHIVRDKCAFSYYCDGKNESMLNLEILAQVIEIADMALQGVMLETLVTATHYHASYVYPDWAYELQYIGQLGNHMFYNLKYRLPNQH